MEDATLRERDNNSPGTPTPRSKKRTISLAVLGLMGLAFNTWAAWNIFLPGAGAGRNDFLSFYAGGSLAGTADLYDSAKVSEVQLRATGLTGDSQKFIRLPFYAFLLKAITWLPYQRAYLVWEILSAMALIAAVVLWPGPAPGTKWLAACWFLPIYGGLFNGQDDTFVWFWLALSAMLLQRRWPLVAGIVLSLAASKYHLLTMVPIVILAQKRWRLGAGVVIGGGILLASSFAIAGLDWPLHYLALLRNPRLVPDLSHVPSLYSTFHAMRYGLYLEIAAAIVLAWAVFQISRRDAAFERPLGCALVAGILVSPHVWLADATLLLPALMPALELQGSPIRFPALALLTPVPWFLLQLPVPLPVLTQILILSFLLTQLSLSKRDGRPAGASEDYLAERCGSLE